MIVSAGFVGILGCRSYIRCSHALTYRFPANRMFGDRAWYSLIRGIPTAAIQPFACILPVIYRRGPAVAGTMAARAGNGAGRQRSGFATVIGDPLPRCETPRS
jgi:hypothetical protein